MLFRGRVSSAASTCLHARQSDVFRFLVDPRNTQRWIEAVEYISHSPQGPIRVGTESLCRIGFLGARIQARYRIVELDEPNSFFGEGSSGQFNYSGRFDFVASSKEGFTDVTWSMTIEYPAILPFGTSYVTHVTSGELKRTLQNLHKIYI
jgi:carbon monoxide dehydrogenase subunit G